MSVPDFSHLPPDFTRQLQAKTEDFKSAQVITRALVEGEQAKKALASMGKLHQVAQRIASTKKTLEAQADKLALRLDELDKKGPDAFGNANAILDQHHADLDAMESELRQLSNLPLASSHEG